MADWIDTPTANKLTLIGLVLSLGACIAFTCHENALGATLFGFSSFFDWFDGSLARRQHEQMSASERVAQMRKPFFQRRGQTDEMGLWSGAFFDAAADKIRYVGSLLPLAANHLWWPLWLSGILIGVFLTGWRVLTVLKGLSKGKANKIGKIKVVAEIVLISWLVLVPLHEWSSLIGNALLAIATFGGAGSLYIQIRSARRTK